MTLSSGDRNTEHKEESKMGTADDKKIYTFGYSATATQMLTGRSAERNAGFFLPHLRAGMHVLDCGCGPGSITLGLAEAVAPGEVVGIDIESSQIDLARTQAAQQGCSNVRFVVGDVLHLPYPEAMFDAMFGHTILMQFHDPLPMLAEVYRVVKPGGVVGFREAAYDGNLYEPPERARHQFFTLFIRTLQHNGSNPLVGRQLGALLDRAGFDRITMSASYTSMGTPEAKQASYERMARLCIESAWMEQAIALGWISPDARDRLSTALRVEGADPGAFFATAYCEVVGWKDSDIIA
jgi:ubiquinone/menaquinone biosynthesis C-methylase UbiE